METARVDLRKLQMLNDRINQCLDALSQVRLSVHGLSHTGAQAPGLAGQGFGAQGIGGQATPFAGFAGVPDPRFAFSQTPLGPVAGIYGGLSHTPQVPFGQLGGFTSAGYPPGIAPTAFPQIANWNPIGGLSHTGIEFDLYNRPIWADPVLAARVKETFPFIGYSLPPVVSLY